MCGRARVRTHDPWTGQITNLTGSPVVHCTTAGAFSHISKDKCSYDKTNKMAYTPSEDSDQPGHSPSLISLCRPHEESLGSELPIERTARLWSDWADAQADLSLRWAHSHFVGLVMSRLMFSHDLAHHILNFRWTAENIHRPPRWHCKTSRRSRDVDVRPARDSTGQGT